MIEHNTIIGAQNGPQAVVSFKAKKTGEESSSKVKVYTDKDSQGFASWGDNNDFPQKLLKEIGKNGAALSGLRVLRRAHYGGGFVLCKEQIQDNKRSIELVALSSDSDLKAFFTKNQMKRFFKETILDLEYFGIAFPEYILSNDYKTINRVKRQKTSSARLELVKDGFIQRVGFSSRWDESPVSEEYIERVNLIDSYWTADQVREYCRKNKIKKFVRPIFYPLINENYYPSPEWHSAVKSGWLDIANSIPRFKKSFLENQLNVKFHISVSEEYFERKYSGDWDNFSFEEKKTLQNEFIDQLNKALSSSDNAGKSILSVMYKDGEGKVTPGVKIETIDNKLKDGAYLDDTSAGNQEILTAIGVDPSLIGAGIPGGKLGAGSGSDKREAWLILSAMQKSNRETTLEIFDFIKEFNNWNKDYFGAFEDTVLTTLDKNPTGTQKAAQI